MSLVFVALLFYENILTTKFSQLNYGILGNLASRPHCLYKMQCNGIETSASSNCYSHCQTVDSSNKISERHHMTTVKKNVVY